MTPPADRRLVGGEPSFHALARRIERATLAATAVLALGALPLGGWRVAAGVLAGSLLSWGSYRVILRGVAALGPAPESGAGASRLSAGAVLGLVARHALLLAAGYVIIARLRLHPIGVLLGVSAVVVAAMVEAVRSWR